MTAPARKLKVATTSLAGCFGCQGFFLFWCHLFFSFFINVPQIWQWS